MNKAIAYYKRKGVILPGHQAEIANWLAENNNNE